MAAVKTQQTGRKRGRYGARKRPEGAEDTAVPRLIDAGEHAYHARVAALAQKYAGPLLERLDAKEARQRAAGREPKLPFSRVGVESAAVQLARLEVHHQVWSELQARGQLSAEEGRAIGGLCREIRAVRAELGLPPVKDKQGAVDFDREDDIDDDY